MPAAIEYLLKSQRVRNGLNGNWEILLKVKVPGSSDSVGPCLGGGMHSGSSRCV